MNIQLHLLESPFTLQLLIHASAMKRGFGVVHWLCMLMSKPKGRDSMMTTCVPALSDRALWSTVLYNVLANASGVLV